MTRQNIVHIHINFVIFIDTPDVPESVVFSFSMAAPVVAPAVVYAGVASVTAEGINITSDIIIQEVMKDI